MGYSGEASIQGFPILQNTLEKIAMAPFIPRDCHFRLVNWFWSVPGRSEAISHQDSSIELLM